MAKRSLSLLLLFLLAATPAFAQAEPGGTPPSTIVSVIGHVVNGTVGGVVPLNGAPMLHIWDAEFQEQGMEHGELSDDGSFLFNSVPFVSGWQYAVMLNYQNVNYYSAPTTIDEGQSVLSVSLTIFEATTSTDAVRVVRQHIVFDVDAPGQLLVGEIHVLVNDGDRAVALPAGAEPASAPLAFVLPEGAENIGVENNTNGRFQPTETGFVDTMPLRPGNDPVEVVVRYTLPYEDALTYTFTAPWPIDGFDILLPARTGLRLDGHGLQPLETREMGDAGEVAIFVREGLAAGDLLTLNLSGPLAAPQLPVQSLAPADTAPVQLIASTPLATVVMILGLLLLGLAAGLYRRPYPELPFGVEEPPTLESLVAEIALLDDALALGSIDETEHSQRRTRLFARAQQVLAEEQ